MITIEQAAAFIGAAAWIPPIWAWVQARLATPKLRVVCDPTLSIWLAGQGPYLHLRMAFFVEQKDLIIERMQVVLRHEDGDSRTFEWFHINEHLGKFSDAAGNQFSHGRDTVPIALKVSTEGFIEKGISFRDPRWRDADHQALSALNKHLVFLQQRAKDDAYHEQALNSKELAEMVEGRTRRPSWKPGRYQIVLNPSSPQVFKIVDSTFSFDLTLEQIHELEKNIPLMATEVMQHVVGKKEKLEWKPVVAQLQRPAA